MFVRSILMAALACLATPLAAGAADAPRMFQDLPPVTCGTPLSGRGKPVAIREPLDEAARAGLMAGLFLTLHDPTGEGPPDADLKAALACPVAKFAADDRVWTIHSGAGGAPLRLITSPDQEDLFMLVKGPALSDAAAWNGRRQGLPAAAAPPAYYLVLLSGQLHFLVRLYDAPPTMQMVADDVIALVDGDARPMASYEAAGGTVNLVLETSTGPQAEFFRPGVLGDGATLFYADGRLATDGPDGALVFRGSGFACRREYGAFQRERIYVFDASDEKLDLACVLEAETGFTHVYVSHRPDASRDRAAWAETIRALEKETGVSRKLANPPTGADGPIQGGRTWIDKDDKVQLILFMRRGPYVYEVRQEHPLDEYDPASETLMALIRQIGVPAPASGEAWRRKR